jgi:hypothetical protein
MPGLLRPLETINNDDYYLRDANTGAGKGLTDLAAAVQLRHRVASGLQTFTVKSRLLTGENAVQFRGNPPFRMEN